MCSTADRSERKSVAKKQSGSSGVPVKPYMSDCGSNFTLKHQNNMTCSCSTEPQENLISYDTLENEVFILEVEKHHFIRHDSPFYKENTRKKKRLGLKGSVIR